MRACFPEPKKASSSWSCASLSVSWTRTLLSRRGLRQRGKRREVSHLPARPNFGLSIKMQCAMFTGVVTPVRRLLANDIHHVRIGMALRITQRPTGNGTDMLLELADRTRFNRPVAG